MRVELRPAGAGDLAGRLDPDLAAGEVRRSDDAVVVGVDTPVDAEALRAAAAAVARALRGDGATVAWRVDPSLRLEPAEQVRAFVEGTAFGAYDPGLWKQRLRRPPGAVARPRGT